MTTMLLPSDLNLYPRLSKIALHKNRPFCRKCFGYRFRFTSLSISLILLSNARKTALNLMLRKVNFPSSKVLSPSGNVSFFPLNILRHTTYLPLSIVFVTLELFCSRICHLSIIVTVCRTNQKPPFVAERVFKK